MSRCPEPINVALLGFGNVGRAFCNYLLHRIRADEVPVHVRAVADSSGGVFLPSPDQLDSLLAYKTARGDISEFTTNKTHDSAAFVDGLRNAGIHVLVEALPTSKSDGQPALDLIRRALSDGIHVVTVDKGPLVHGFEVLQEAARSGGSKLAFTGTTGVRPPEEVEVGTVTEIRGVLNGTSNYILTEMQQRNLSFEHALAQAREAGIAEPNPSLDVEGWDTAFKILILSRSLMRAPTQLHEVSRIGIGADTEKLIQTARNTGRRGRLVGRARIWQNRVRVSVAPKIVGAESPFYEVEGTAKAAVFTLKGSRGIVVHSRSGPDAISETIFDDVMKVAS